MENFKKENSLEQENINNIIEIASNNALTSTELIEIEKNLRNNVPFKKLSKEFVQEIKKSIAEFKSISSFRKAGEFLGWDKKDMKGYRNYLEYIIEHENAHLNMAEKENQKIHGYWIIMIKTQDGIIIPQPAAGYELLENLSDEEFYRIEKLIVEAPRNYGNFLSPGDEEKLKNLDYIFKKDI